MTAKFQLFLVTAFWAFLPLHADVVRSAASGPWSSDKTWENGALPKAGDSVLIKKGHDVVYDISSNAVIRVVTVAGTLRFSREKDTKICAALIKVQSSEDISEDGFDCHGPIVKSITPGPRPLLEIGSADAPISADHTALIRLTYIEGMNKESCPALVCCDGRMEIHGAPLSHSWVKLGNNVNPGSNEIELAEPVTGWKPGDHLLFPTTEMSEFYQERNRQRVIPSILDDSQTEEAELVGTQGTGMLIKVPLKYKHQAIGEFRGEVANLSRNVVIESADPKGERGHTMYHSDSAGSISYAEFRHLGKKGVLGRYPIHFHMCGDTMRGSSVIGASIWDSDNRWIAIHGTNYLLIRDCVGYRSVGHGFFLEDGTEVDNILDRNLAVQAFMGKPLPAQTLTFDENDAAGFWWGNCMNSFTNNVATECEKFGFRFQMVKTDTFSPEISVKQPDGSHKRVDVRTIPFIRFEDNEAHSQRRFCLNLGGFHGQSETADLDRDGNVIDRASYLGGSVDGVGPDWHHPFIIKNFKAWRSQWGFTTAASNVKIDGFTAYDINYVFWRSNVSGNDYNNLHLSDIHVSTFLNPWGLGPSRENKLLYLDPVDDLPPVTTITNWKWLDGGLLRVSGVAVDNTGVREVIVNGKPATLENGLVCNWSQIISVTGDSIEITAESTDIKGNKELTPHRLKLFRDDNVTSQPLAETEATPAAPPTPPPAKAAAASAENDKVREEKIDDAKLPYPLWDGKESVADYAKRAKLEPKRTLDLNGAKLDLVLIPAGSFIMGTASSDPGMEPDEQPRHRVYISKPFYMGKTELTQAQYSAVMKTNPSYFPAPDKPVETVSWLDAQAFLKKLGQGARLPTEAEWEFACRAGTQTEFSSGNDEKALSTVAWWGRGNEPFHGNAPDGTSPVALKAPNAFGLYDMHGNVYEWCSDVYTVDYYQTSPALDPTGPAEGEYHVLRGGSWQGEGWMCRSANRNGFSAKSHGFLVGFRVVMPITK